MNEIDKQDQPRDSGGMKRKKAKITEGYSLAEMRVITDRMIDESVDRLRKRLRAAWKKAGARNVRHGATV